MDGLNGAVTPSSAWMRRPRAAARARMAGH
jgi:hypothetical protein